MTVTMVTCRSGGGFENDCSVTVKGPRDKSPKSLSSALTCGASLRAWGLAPGRALKETIPRFPAWAQIIVSSPGSFFFFHEYVCNKLA